MAETGGWPAASPSGPSLPLRTPRPAHRLQQQRHSFDHEAQGPTEMVQMLIVQAEDQAWGPAVSLCHLMSFMCRCQPCHAAQLAAAGAGRATICVMRGMLAAGEGPDATELVMSKVVELLLLLVEAAQDDLAIDLLTPEGVDLLMQVLCSPVAGGQARQQVALLLHRMVSSSPVLRVLLLKYNGLHGLCKALQDPLAACDLLYMQEILWSFVGLADSAVSLGGQLEEPELLVNTLVPLLKLLQLPGYSHLSHIQALLIRVLHVMAADPRARELLGQLQVVEVCVHLIATERQAQIEAAGGLPSLSLTTPMRPNANGTSQSLPPPPEPMVVQGGVTPLMSRANSGASQRQRTISGDGARHRTSADGQGQMKSAGSHDQPISPAAVGPESRHRTSMDGQRPPQVPRTHTHGKHKSCLLAMPYISAWDRLMATLLLQAIEVKLGKASRPTTDTTGTVVGSQEGMSVYALVCLGLLLPLLVDQHTSAVHRLCLVREAVVAIKVLVGDSPATKAQAVAAGAVPVLVHLVATGDASPLAWQACDALGFLASPQHIAQLLWPGSVEEVAQLLQESADALHLLTVRKQLEHHSITGEQSTLPTPNAAYAHRPAKQVSGNTSARVQLVGRQRLSFCGSSPCMYFAHDAFSMCDYCVPSACLRTLLRLLTSCASAASLLSDPSTAADPSTSADLSTVLAGAHLLAGEAARRLVAHGGLYTIFLLMHHELSTGVHHSKVASSLISLLQLILDAGLDIQDEVRKVGGLALMVALVVSMARVDSGAIDIYQLRVQTCLAMQRLLEGNSASKMIAREHGLLPPLVAMLQASVARQQEVLDDDEQVCVCVLDLLAACIMESGGNQEALVSAGGLRLLTQLVSSDLDGVGGSLGRAGSGSLRAPQGTKSARVSVAVLAAAVRTLGFLVESNEAAQLVLLSPGALPRLVQAADMQPASSLAQCVVYTCCQLMRGHPAGKPAVVAAGLLPVLIKMMHAQPEGLHLPAAMQAVYALCSGDVDLQNECVDQGGLHALETLIRARGPYLSHALWVLCCLLHNNAWVRNAARQAGAGFARSLLATVVWAGTAQPQITVAAAHALAQFCQSSTPNCEVVADEGGVEAVSELMQAVMALQPPASPSTRAAVPPLPEGMEPLAGAVAMPAVLDGVLRLLGALLEFNATNQKIVRDTGCLGQVAEFVQQVAAVRDLSALRRTHLLPTVAAACAVLARAAQDCEANQQRLINCHEDLAPALFRILNVDEPYVALEAARALEFLAIRSDLVHDGHEARGEFEADAIRALVKVLHSRGPAEGAALDLQTKGGMSVGKTGSDALDGGLTPTVNSGTVKEAAAVLLAIVAAAVEGAKASAPAVGGVPATQGGAPSLVAVESANQAGGLLNLAFEGANMGTEQWARLAGMSAAAFQPVAKLLSDSPWRPVKVQLCWVLFLLATRSPVNRELLARLERTSVTPLANQLANVEAFLTSAAAAATLAEIDLPPLPVSTMPQDTVDLRPAGDRSTTQGIAPLSPQPLPSPVSARPLSVAGPEGSAAAAVAGWQVPRGDGVSGTHTPVRSSTPIRGQSAVQKESEASPLQDPPSPATFSAYGNQFSKRAAPEGAALQGEEGSGVAPGQGLQGDPAGNPAGVSETLGGAGEGPVSGRVASLSPPVESSEANDEHDELSLIQQEVDMMESLSSSLRGRVQAGLVQAALDPDEASAEQVLEESNGPM